MKTSHQLLQKKNVTKVRQHQKGNTRQNKLKGKSLLTGKISQEEKKTSIISV